MAVTENQFYDRRGVLVTPQAHSVIKPRRGAWVLAKAQDSVLMLWPEFTHGIPDLPGGGVDEGETLEQASQRVEDLLPQPCALVGRYGFIAGDVLE